MIRHPLLASLGLIGVMLAASAFAGLLWSRMKSTQEPETGWEEAR